MRLHRRHSEPEPASPGGEFWCEYAWLGDRTAPGVLVRTTGDRITSVEEGVPAPHGSARLPGLVVPGLANAHSHAFHRALRARTQRDHGSFWTWRTLMYRAAAGLGPELYRVLATAVYAEMALAGVTRVGEFHYVHHRVDGTPYDDPNAMGLALAQAAGAAGLRLTLLDTCYLSSGFGKPPEPAQQRFADADATAWARRVDALAQACAPLPHVTVGAAAHSVRALPEAALAEVAAWARHAGAPLHVHLSEQPAENTACLEAYGRTPTRVLADARVLGPRTTAVHATHLTAEDVALLTESGTGVCFCPTTERDLADGIGPARQLASIGSPFSLGSDSHAVIDLLEEARAVETHERLASGVRGVFPAAALLGFATTGGHHALGDATAGVIAPGAMADLVALDLGSVRTAGCGPSAETAVFAATAADVTDVVASGVRVVEARRHTLVPDPAALLAEAVQALLPDGKNGP